MSYVNRADDKMRILTFISRRYICKFSCAKAEAIFRYAGDIGERDGGSRETESGTNSLLPFSSHRWFGSLLGHREQTVLGEGGTEEVVTTPWNRVVTVGYSDMVIL